MLDWLADILHGLATLWPGRARGEPTETHPPVTRREAARRRGLSLVEMLLALAISSMLLTATMVAVDASFTAYAIAAESASTQTSTRLVVNRLLTLVRTNEAHGPLDPADAPTGETVTESGDVLTSTYLSLIDGDRNTITLRYDATNNRIMLKKEPASGATATEQPILGGVTDCKFYLRRRTDNDGVDVLERGSIDFTVEADADASFEIEVGDIPPVRVVASTKPRRVN